MWLINSRKDNIFAKLICGESADAKECSENLQVDTCWSMDTFFNLT